MSQILPVFCLFYKSYNILHVILMQQKNSEKLRSNDSVIMFETHLIFRKI